MLNADEYTAIIGMTDGVHGSSGQAKPDRINIPEIIRAHGLKETLPGYLVNKAKEVGIADDKTAAVFLIPERMDQQSSPDDRKTVDLFMRQKRVSASLGTQREMLQEPQTQPASPKPENVISFNLNSLTPEQKAVTYCIT
jgi:hypothetical protein